MRNREEIDIPVVGRIKDSENIRSRRCKKVDVKISGSTVSDEGSSTIFWKWTATLANSRSGSEAER